METRKTTSIARTQMPASVTDLGCIVRFNSFYSNSFSFSFVSDETLQLVETPVTKNPVHFPSLSLFPDTFQVFHYNPVSFKPGNYVFADVVVYPSHKSFFSSGDFLEQSSRRTSTFGLKFTTQMLEFPPSWFDRTIKPPVRTDGELALQTNLSEMLINKRVKFDIIPDTFIPGSIDTELQSFPVNLDSFGYCVGWFNPYFGDSSHSNNRTQQNYIYLTLRCPVYTGKMEVKRANSSL